VRWWIPSEHARDAYASGGVGDTNVDSWSSSGPGASVTVPLLNLDAGADRPPAAGGKLGDREA
jgi:hypothetical protein